MKNSNDKFVKGNTKKTDKSEKRNIHKNGNIKKDKEKINARNNKAKYSDDEIAKSRHLDTIAKLLVRDRISNENIDTTDQWIAISNLEYNEKWDKNGNFKPEILSFNAELYNKKERPKYSNEMTVEEKHQLTYEVAENDIEKQKRREKRSGKNIIRPSFNVKVLTRQTKDGKTEYQVERIERKDK